MKTTTKIMTAKQLLSNALLAFNSKTMYVKGAFGWLATSKNKARAIASYDYNKERKDFINAAPYRTWFFDCVCFVKGLLWGWCANYGNAYGGAEYKANGVPDATEKQLLAACGGNQWKITNLSHLVPGALLYMKGHVGIYKGDGKVYECAPSLGGVDITDLNYQRWTDYGLLPWIDYEGAEPQPKPEPEELFKGTRIVLNNAPLYVSYDAKKPANHLTGYYYISDGIDFSGRYRICKDRIYCGVITKVIGYVNKGDCICVR